MATHELKTWIGPFRQIVLGTKRHQYRYNDRGFMVGDELVLKEYDNYTDTYTGHEVKVTVTAMTEGPEFGIPPGYVVMSIDKQPHDLKAVMDKIMDGLTDAEKEAMARFEREKKKIFNRNVPLLNRLKIARNAIHREWQKAHRQASRLPESATKEAMKAYCNGLATALTDIYQEFPELDKLAADQKPSCPLCGKVMGYHELSHHILEHTKGR